MRILHIIGTLNVGGAETLVINILKNIDRKKYHFDFLVFKKMNYPLVKQVKALGANIIYLQSPNEIGMLNFILKLKKICKEKKYDAVHAHTQFNCGPCMLAACLAGIKIRISHSHSTRALDNKKSIQKYIYYKLSKILINIFATDCIACGIEAGKFLYYPWKKYIVLKNGIDINKFVFDAKIRDKIRRDLNIPLNAMVIGNVGRLMYIKNQSFLIDIFNEIFKDNSNSFLVIIGDGVLKDDLLDKARTLKLEKNIIFTGNLENVNEYYNIFDVFAFPSLFEGLPLTLVEAQCNGLHIIASNNISIESNITGNIKFVKLDNEDEWKDSIIDYSREERYNEVQKVIDSGYSIKNTVEQLIKIYEK